MDSVAHAPDANASHLLTTVSVMVIELAANAKSNATPLNTCASPSNALRLSIHHCLELIRSSTSSRMLLSRILRIVPFDCKETPIEIICREPVGSWVVYVFSLFPLSHAQENEMAVRARPTHFQMKYTITRFLYFGEHLDFSKMASLICQCQFRCRNGSVCSRARFCPERCRWSICPHLIRDKPTKQIDVLG